jgi:hypothetical protein
MAADNDLQHETYVLRFFQQNWSKEFFFGLLFSLRFVEGFMESLPKLQEDLRRLLLQKDQLLTEISCTEAKIQEARSIQLESDLSTFAYGPLILNVERAESDHKTHIFHDYYIAYGLFPVAFISAHKIKPESWCDDKVYVNVDGICIRMNMLEFGRICRKILAAKTKIGHIAHFAEVSTIEKPAHYAV